MQANMSGILIEYPDDVKPDELIDMILAIQNRCKQQNEVVDEIKFTMNDGKLEIVVRVHPHSSVDPDSL